MSNTPTCRLLVADDHPVLAKLLAEFFQTIPGVECVGTAHDGATALDICMSGAVDVLVLDLGLPRVSGLEVLSALKDAKLPLRTLVFSALVNESTVIGAFEKGALGFLEKSAPFEDLQDAVGHVFKGDPYLGAAVRPLIAKMVRQQSSERRLNDQELLVLRHLNAGHNPKHIARETGLSLSGVYKAIHRIKTKLGARSSADLLFAGIRLGVTVDAGNTP